MISYPPAMKTGMAFALLAGIVCFAAMAVQFDPSKDNMIREMSIYLLMAVVCFAVAGGFSQYAQWSRPLLGGMVFFIAAMAIAFYIVRFVPLWFFVVEVVLCVIMLTTLSSVQLKGYLNKN